MPELRIVLTVLPVGPRGADSLVAGGRRWFAVQIAAGFADPAPPEELDSLWPWALHVVQNGAVELTGWLIDPAAGPFDLQAAVPTQEIDFQNRLRDAIQRAYSTGESRENLDLTLRLPGDPNARDPRHQRESFPARVQYLATLPGEVALRLLATVYVAIDVDRLFQRVDDVWQPSGKTLWIAPRLVARPGPAAGGQHPVALTGPPIVVTPESGLFKVEGLDDGLTVNAYGPGFDLRSLLEPDSHGTAFDLTDYWLPVGPGDRRFAEVETLLLAALDPFSELGDAKARLSGQITLVDAAGERPLPSETAEALLDLWQVQALIGELRAAQGGVEDLARRLLAPGQALPTLDRLPDRLPNPGLSLADQVETMALLLDISGPTLRERLRGVAARAGFNTAAAWLAQAFDAALAANASQAVADLAARWRFGESDPAKLAERRLALARTVIDDRREKRQVPPLLSQLQHAGGGASGDHLRDLVRQSLGQRWAGDTRLGSTVLPALVQLGLVTTETLKLASPEALAEAHLETVWRQSTDPRPELPGRGLALVLGPEAQRLVHEDKPAGDFNGIYGEIAGLALLGRRGKDRADLETRPWRLVTGGTALADPLGDHLFDTTVDEARWLHELLAVPLRPAFQQGVARADVEYHGQPMLAQSPLTHAYAAQDYALDEPGGLEAAYSFQALGGVSTIGAVTEAAKASRAPVLRYGDSYQFWAALVDQAGGLPTGIARDGEPWKLDTGKLMMVKRPPAQEIPCRRSVPVGEINLLPAADPKTTKREWPSLPGDVFLRSRETWAYRHRDADSLPVLLLSQNIVPATPDRGRFPGTLSRYQAQILPPAIDEHTLLAWAVPALDDPDPATTRQKLIETLAQILATRQRTGDAERIVPVHDPAVAALGVRIVWFGPDNVRFEPAVRTVTLTAGDGPFERLPLTLSVAAAAFGAAPAATFVAERIEVAVPEGAFATVEIWPLVPKADFEERFAAAGVFKDLVDTEAPFADHVAFRPSVLLSESATDLLPDAKDLWENLKLTEQNGAVAVRFTNQVPDLAFVDRFALERERWVWRNRPVVTGKLFEIADEDERRRRAASGPPEELFDPVKRDLLQGPVADWERIADIDRGFVDRGNVSDRWPRKAPVDDHDAGGSAGDVQLFLDDRDAVTAADFLRYGLRVRSRYAGVLPSEKRERSAMGPQDETRRRIVAGFRGKKVKPPKILAVVPLTRQLEKDPLASRTGATPFLVLLDETFFREYGIGERLEARLSLESLDIGERPDTTLPYRTGPLPDHWLTPAQPPYPGSTQDADEHTTPRRLDVFGPFGYSLDTSPAEALANASAFVVYPPEEVKPHWAMFTRFRRVLDKPSAGQQSNPSDNYALYTLPDSSLLARPLPSGPAPALELMTSTDGASSFVPRGLQLLLDPLTAPGGAGKNSDAASQYRYFLLVSRVLRGASQALDVELPEGLWRLRLFDPAGGFQTGTFDVEFGPGASIAVEALQKSREIKSGGAYRARVVEVLLNGRYQGPSPLDEQDLGWFDFWRALLDDQGTADATGMIRRVSDAFAVLAGRPE